MASELIVQTKYGPVQGRHRIGLNDVKYVSFQGIRYATAPVGPLRFKAPQPPVPWTEMFDATAEGPISPSVPLPFESPVTLSSDEDCLRLNVFKSNANFTSKVPVMVFIHGGGFVWGSSSEVFNGPEVLMRRDVIMVSMNYRLGVLGFLSISDPAYDIPGNAGLKDQTMALRWVAENISQFGGDPQNVTIFGISAGGASVHYHLMSDHSKGLFQKAIIQSGSALNSWANRHACNDLNERLAKNLGWDGAGGDKAIWDLILSTDTAELMKHQPAVNELENQVGMLFNYVPVVEPYDKGNCFVPKPLVEMNRSAWGKKVPLILGGTTDEGYMFYNEHQKIREFYGRSYFDNALPKELDVPYGSEARRMLGDKLKFHYYGAVTPTLDNLDVYLEMLNEKYFWHGINAIVKARTADPHAAPTYLYRFDFTSERLPFMHMLMADRYLEGKIVHCEDLVYLMNPVNVLSVLNAEGPEWETSDNLLSLFTSFAATGKPISDATKSAEWKPVQTGVTPKKCLNIGKTTTMIDLPNTAHIAFWDSLYDL